MGRNNRPSSALRTAIDATTLEMLMPADKLTIDDGTVFDNIDAKQVEFSAEIDEEAYEFAVQYDVLEALSGDAPDGDAQETFTRYSDTIAEAGLVALRRDADQTVIVISEHDLEQSV